ncbi:oxidoreductase [Streptomyces sp. NPDC047981]|uniref:DUF7847 domain-containing protein n=1 Tax=Streptomyces sp. NPDC047981 TaxID=3154610 RepID=UPI0034496B17
MTIPTGPYGYGYPPPPPPPKPGVIPLAPLGLSQILTGAFTTIGRHWKQLLGVAAAAYGGALLLLGAAVGISYAVVSDHVPRVFDLPRGQEPSWDDGRPLLIAFGAVWLVAIVGMMLASAVVYAASPAVLQEAVLGRRTTFGAIWRRSWSRVPAVIGTVLLSALVVVVPMVLFVLAMVGFVAAIVASGSSSDAGVFSPVVATVFFLLALATMPLATWIWVKVSLAPAAAVFENQGAVASLRRSNELVRGSWWRIFGALLVAGIMSSVANWMIQQVLSLLLSVPVSLTDTTDFDTPGEVLLAFAPVLVVLALCAMAAQAFCSFFPPLVTGLVYVDQRIRKENLAPALAQAAGTPYPFTG